MDANNTGIGYASPEGTVMVPRPTFWALADNYTMTHEVLADLDTRLKQSGLLAEERRLLEQERQQCQGTLATISEALIAKLDDLAAVRRRIESDVQMLKAEEQRIYDRRKVTETALAALGTYVLETLEKQNSKGMKTPENTVTVRGNGGVQPLTLVPDQIEPGYRVVTVRMPALDYAEAAISYPDMQVVADEPDNTKIRMAIAAGTAVNGAKLEDRGKHLRWS